MRFLCVSDIHGHAKALRAVLAEAEVRGFDQLVVCGDICFPGPEPLEVWKLLLQHKALVVQGIGDRALAQIDPRNLSATSEVERARIERLRQMHAELGDIIIARLGKLPTTARLPVENGAEMLIVHGSPVDPTEPFTPEMTDDEMLALVGDDPADIVVCGGSHVPFERHLDDLVIVGVGSVGEAPGGGYANAAIIETTPLGIGITRLDVMLD